MELTGSKGLFGRRDINLDPHRCPATVEIFVERLLKRTICINYLTRKISLSDKPWLWSEVKQSRTWTTIISIVIAEERPTSIFDSFKFACFTRISQSGRKKWSYQPFFISRLVHCNISYCLLSSIVRGFPVALHELSCRRAGNSILYVFRMVWFHVTTSKPP